jgi:hypothetical protein
MQAWFARDTPEAAVLDEARADLDPLLMTDALAAGARAAFFDPNAERARR